MVTVTASQKASISPEAAEFLSKIPMIPFAGLLSPYLASSKRVQGLRNDMATKVSPNEEDLMARHNLKLTPTKIATVPVLIIEPPTLSSEHEGKIILNFFGGGFVMGSARERAALLMATEMRIRVYSVEYSKSPETRYPGARDEALTVYRQLISSFGAKNIYGMGSSAGGQILVSMLLIARSEKLPMPARLFLCTPALDLSGAGDSLVSNEGRDVMPASFLSAIVKQNYQLDTVDVKDSYYSPVYADYDASFPPTVISVGTRDLFLSDGVRMYWKLREAGVEAELLVSEGMWHGFNWNETLPEAVRLRRCVREFLASSL
ncbi:Alpha/Beta hydrolase protein [Clohesyomyces aquaticus]|uniref:Alpha/Beta hydrolase protein n=1 Tax=Clohesyomyces aquaticus TaxID=1231657 RepID=A0A1Y1YQQ6_9PLEO|nr:Alpha/Beta hydrolase protein [Clohesyomyces aquaticus]